MIEKTRAFKVIRGHCLGGSRGDVAPGDVLTVPGDLTPAEAKSKVAVGHIVEISPAEAESARGSADAPREPEVTAPGEIEVRDPEAEDRDPKPKPVRKPRKRKSTKGKPRSK